MLLAIDLVFEMAAERGPGRLMLGTGETNWRACSARIRLAQLGMRWYFVSLLSLRLPSVWLALVACCQFAVAEARKEFRAGAAVANISPWMGLSIEGNMHDHKGTNLHDQLHARCVVLDNGETRLAIVLADSCMIPRRVFDEAKKIVFTRS